MPLNTSGPIRIGGSTTGQSINLELGRAAGATSSLNESALRTLAVVPSGTISLSNFYGKSNAPTVGVLITDLYSENLNYGTGALARYRLNANGTLTYTFYDPDQGFSYSTLKSGEWLLSGATATNYEVYATVSGAEGTLTGTLGSWLSLGSVDREWTLGRSVPAGQSGTASRALSVSIRRISTGTTEDTATITLYTTAGIPP